MLDHEQQTYRHVPARCQFCCKLDFLLQADEVQWVERNFNLKLCAHIQSVKKKYYNQKKKLNENMSTLFQHQVSF